MIYQKKEAFNRGIIISFISLMLFFGGMTAFSQAQPPNDDCSNAQVLCTNESLEGTTKGATFDYFTGCLLNNPAVWYSFITNDRAGIVNIEIIRDSLCGIVNIPGDGLQAVILTGAIGSTNPCGDLDFIELDQYCSSDSLEIIIKMAVSENTEYWILVSGQTNDTNVPTECDFGITITGEPIEIYAGGDEVIYNGESYIIEASGPDPGTFSWDDPNNSLENENTLSPVASPTETTSYTLTGDIGECKNLTDKVTITVSDEGVLPTNLILPNHDKLSTWSIGLIENFPKAVVEVYNRWGQRVFVSIGYDNANGWNGTSGGSELPEGTYYYVIQLNRSDLNIKNVQTGFVAIVR